MAGIQSRMTEGALTNSVGGSGGPVINRKGELVGMVSYGDLQSVHAIDVVEIREFLKGSK